MLKNLKTIKNILVKNLNIMDFFVILYFLLTIFLYLSNGNILTKIAENIYPVLAFYMLAYYFSKFYTSISRHLIPSINENPKTESIFVAGFITVFGFITYNAIRSYINDATGHNPDLFPNTIIMQQVIFIIEIVTITVMLLIIINTIYILFAKIKHKKNLFINVKKIIILLLLLASFSYLYNLASNRFNSKAMIVLSIYALDSYRFLNCNLKPKDFKAYEEKYKKTMINIQKEGIRTPPSITIAKSFKVEGKDFIAVYKDNEISLEKINLNCPL